MPSLFPLTMAQFEPPYLIKGVPEDILEIGGQVHCVPIAAPPGGETFRHHGQEDRQHGRMYGNGV